MTRKSTMGMSFTKAFYGGGTDIDKAMAAWAIYDYHMAMGQVKMAECFDQIADFYYKRHQEKMREFQKKVIDS